MLPVHPEASEELDSAVALYESERPGTGLKLLLSVRRRIELASRFPVIGSSVRGFEARFDVRHQVVKRFPFVVITARIRGERMVVAVAHTRREPGYWKKRIK